MENSVDSNSIDPRYAATSYYTDGAATKPVLSFDILRLANKLRLPQFKNRKGEPAHSKADGSDWSPAQWLQAVVGELGEFANIRKKYERGDITHAEYEVEAKKELADVQVYLDILALRALDYREGTPHPTGVNLGQATAEKFNEVSDRVGCGLKFGDGRRLYCLYDNGAFVAGH